jgi:hypothetical protein
LLILGGVGLAVVIAIAAAVVFFTQKPGPAPASAPAGSPPRDLSAILLSIADTGTIMGTSMEAANQTEQTLTAPGTVSNSTCVGALDSLQAQVYQGSGFTAVRGQALRSTNPPHRVYQAAVEFPTAERAHEFVRTSANNWSACAGQTATVTNGGQSTQWTFGELNGTPPRIVQRHTEAVANGRECQHVLRAVSRVVIEVQACGQGSITNQGGQIADQMAARVTP